MTDEQIQALEALDTAAHGRTNQLTELSSVKVWIKPSILNELRTQGLIVTVGRGLFILTTQGRDKAIENQSAPPEER